MFGGNHPNKTTNYEIALVNKAKEEKKKTNHINNFIVNRFVSISRVF